MVSLLKFSSQEKVRSTIHLLGKGTNLSVSQNPFQPREFVYHGFEHLFRPDTVMNVRRMDSHRHGQPQSVNHYVLLPALYLFVSVYSPLTINMMGGPDTP